MTTIQTSLKPASFGSVSHGTLRTEDLLSVFLSELEWQVRRNGEFFSRPENFPLRDRFSAVIGEGGDFYADDGETIPEEKLGQADEFLNETLIDALQVFAPAYGYFGAHCGDGADFGFWPGDIEEIKEQVGFVSSEEQEWPDDEFRGEWLRINERGNCALCVRGDDGKDLELWSLV